MGQRRFDLRDVQIDDGCLDVAVPEQFLNGVEVDAVFEQVRGKRMPEGMHRDILFYFRLGYGLIDDVLDTPFAHGLPGREPFEEIYFGFVVREIVRQLVSDERREHDVSVFLSLSLSDVDLFSIDIDIGNLDKP